MKKTAQIAWYVIITALALYGSGIIPAIVPALVPTTSRQGSAAGKFQIATGSTPTAGNCATWDGSQNLIDSGIATCGGLGTSVNSFKGRTGAVVPAANDYSFDQIAGGSNLNALHIGGGGTLDTTSTGINTANGIRIYTVSTLPGTGGDINIAYVSDGSTTTDCTTGSGSNRVLCLNNGSAWVAAGSAFSSSGLLPWNPATAATPPTTGSWTFVNPSGGGNAGTFTDIRNAVQLTTPGSNNVKYAYIAAPGASGSAFTITAHLAGYCLGTNTQAPSMGLMVGDTGNKIQVAGLQGTGSSVWRAAILNWTDSTTFSSQPVSTGGLQFTDLVWIQLVYDGSGATNTINLKLGSAGTTGNFDSFGSTTATFLATNPAKIGFFVSAQNAGPCNAALTYWSVTQP